MKIFCFISFLLIASFLFAEAPESEIQTTDEQLVTPKLLEQTEAQESLESSPVETRMPLFAVCVAGNIEQVRSAVKAGADINAEEEGISLLMFAVYMGNVDIVKALVDAGADVNFKNADGVTPILIAAYQGNSAIAKLLIDSGVHPEDKGIATYIAAMREEPDVVEVLQPFYNLLDYRKLRRNEYKTGDGFSVFFKVSRIYVDKDSVYRASCLLMPNKDALPNSNYEFFIESKNRFIFIEGDSIEANISYISLQSIVMSEIPYRAVEQALFQLNKIIDIW
ncbi:MAG: ankyrin repeat domain-containing protein [Treponema sp.]|nr:ankyrin repeat domain-containing protein [Treponema sp.]